MGTWAVCAMSGGVDSSVAAALLLEQGYRVIGVTLRVWPAEIDHARACCSLSAVDDARRVATHLGMPFYVIDVKEAFGREVIAPFVEEYRAGRTPNPCIACNRRIKFSLLLDKARELGAEYLATGHYARIGQEGDRRFVRRGSAGYKDQSYVLYGLTQAQLAHVLFPLGELDKHDTRARAADLGLRVANKPDSQEICFVPDNDYRAYLREHAPDCLIPGEVVDTAGRVLARHEGLAGFTIGQRKGLGLSGGGRPLYVVALDPARGQVVVGDREALAGRTLVADDVVAGRLSEADLAAPVRVTAQIRANMAPQPAIAQITDGRLAVAFDAPQRAITPGQAVVCYLGDAVACGGTISVSLCPSVSL